MRGSGGGSKGDRGGGMSGVSMGGGGGGGSDGKPTRVRTVLNEKQLHTLRTCYAANPRPDALMKEQLVEMTGLSPRVIRVWFQNKRCKDKKKAILMKQIQQQEKVDPSHINRPINTYYHIRTMMEHQHARIHHQLHADDSSDQVSNHDHLSITQPPPALLMYTPTLVQA